MTQAPPKQVWDAAWFKSARQSTRELWRAVEAQHRVATMRLVDNLEEQRLLEDLLEASKPPLPPGSKGLHFLLHTPFRYLSPQATRFRRANAPGIWYGAHGVPTICAELAYWRWRFVTDSDGLRATVLITEHTLFAAQFKGHALDLTRAPWVAQRDTWRDPQDYAPCQRLADEVRAANALRTSNASTSAIAAIRYESARREGGLCMAVLEPASLTVPEPHRQQTWVCKASKDAVMLTHDREGVSFSATYWQK